MANDTGSVNDVDLLYRIWKEETEQSGWSEIGKDEMAVLWGEITRLRGVVAKAHECRTAQCEYFKTRSRDAPARSLRYEREVDALLADPPDAVQGAFAF